MSVPITLAPWLDLQTHLADLKLIFASIGPDNILYLLAEDAIFDYTMVESPSVMRSFVIFCCDGYGIDRVDISPVPGYFHYVQPLPNRKLLLVNARTYSHSLDGSSANGYVYDMAGALQRTIFLGDGIEDVQTTRDGRIWVSFFDEGVFAGRNKLHDSFGRYGLICLDEHGKKLYEYQPPLGAESIFDCYALNVANDRDAWCYYYVGFPLVHIRDYQVVGLWQCPLHYSHKFMLRKEWVLMQGDRSKSEMFHLFSLQEGGQMKPEATYYFLDREGEPILAKFVCMRDAVCVLITQEFCYRIFLSDVVGS